MGRRPDPSVSGHAAEPERLDLLRRAVLAELHGLVQPPEKLAAPVLRALCAPYPTHTRSHAPV